MDTKYTPEEIKNKWLPNAQKMFSFYQKKALRGEPGARKSAQFWAQATREYTQHLKDNNAL